MWHYSRTNLVLSIWLGATVTRRVILEMMTQGLRSIRERRALTQVELGKLAGVSPDTIIDLELGRRKPRPSTRRKLARALRVRVEEIDYPGA